MRYLILPLMLVGRMAFAICEAEQAEADKDPSKRDALMACQIMGPQRALPPAPPPPTPPPPPDPRLVASAAVCWGQELIRGAMPLESPYMRDRQRIGKARVRGMMQRARASYSGKLLPCTAPEVRSALRCLRGERCTEAEVDLQITVNDL